MSDASLSGTMAGRDPALNLPFLRGKAGHNDYYAHVLAQPRTDRHRFQVMDLRCFYNKCVVFTTNVLFCNKYVVFTTKTSRKQRHMGILMRLNLNNI